MGKKLRPLLCSLCMLTLLIACFPAQGKASGAAGPDAELKAAFISGSMALREIPLFSGPGPYTLHIPASFFEEVMEGDVGGKEAVYSQDRAYVTVELSAQEMEANMPAAFYFSPDGGKILCLDQDKAYVVEGYDVTLIVADAQRGVPDTYGSFAKFAATPPCKWVGSEGVVWSPDGRYAVLTNYEAALKYIKFIYGLYIIDMATGQLYCADTYPDDPFQSGAAVFQACFDPSGRYVYYMLYGRAYDDSMVSLMRYDMETGEKERLYACPTLSAYPRLQWAGQDRLINLKDSLKAQEHMGLNVFEEKNGAWTSSSPVFSQPAGILRPTYMEVGPAGLGVLLQMVQLDSIPFLLPGRFDTNAGFKGYDELLLIDNFDTLSATSLPMSDYADPRLLADKLSGSQALRCVNIHLSPDGRYALLLMMNDKEELGFLMMDLETLTLKAVKAPMGTASVRGGYSSPGGASYPVGYGWFAGNKLAILTGNGLKLYEFAD